MLSCIYRARTDKEKYFKLIEFSYLLPEFVEPKATPQMNKSKMDYVFLAVINYANANFGSAITLISKADGNCLFSSVYQLLSGDKKLIHKIKVRAMVCLAQNFKELDSNESRYLFSRHSASVQSSGQVR